MNRDQLIAALRSRATIELEALVEDMAPENHFEDAADVAFARDGLAAGNEWAWCLAYVTVSFAGLVGHDSLGACSYHSEADFRQDGTYEDMVDVALGDLADQLISTRDALVSIGLCGEAK